MQDPIMMPVGWWVQHVCAPPPTHHPKHSPPYHQHLQGPNPGAAEHLQIEKCRSGRNRSSLRQSIFYVCETSVYART